MRAIARWKVAAMGVLWVGASACGGNLAAPSVDGGARLDVYGGPPFDVGYTPHHPDGSADAPVYVDATMMRGGDSMPPDGGGDGAMGATDGPCQPSLPPTFSATPKEVPVPSCTAAAMSATVEHCFPPTGSETSCAPYAQTSCYQCIVTSQNALAWGPFVQDGAGFSHPNFGGCVASLDPTPGGIACGNAYTQYEQCFDEACVPNCPNAEATVASFQEFEACELQASKGACSALQASEESACAPVTAASTTCTNLINLAAGPNGGDVTDVLNYVAVFCELPDAGGPPDAGVDAGITPVDSGAHTPDGATVMRDGGRD